MNGHRPTWAVGARWQLLTLFRISTTPWSARFWPPRPHLAGEPCKTLFEEEALEDLQNVLNHDETCLNVLHSRALPKSNICRSSNKSTGRGCRQGSPLRNSDPGALRPAGIQAVLRLSRPSRRAHVPGRRSPPRRKGRMRYSARNKLVPEPVYLLPRAGLSSSLTSWSKLPSAGPQPKTGMQQYVT